MQDSRAGTDRSPRCIFSQTVSPARRKLGWARPGSMSALQVQTKQRFDLYPGKLITLPAAEKWFVFIGQKKNVVVVSEAKGCSYWTTHWQNRPIVSQAECETLDLDIDAQTIWRLLRQQPEYILLYFLCVDRENGPTSSPSLHVTAVCFSQTCGGSGEDWLKPVPQMDNGGSKNKVPLSR